MSGPFTWMTQVFSFLAGGAYQTAPDPIVVGSSGPMAIDQYGRLIVVPAAMGTAFGVAAPSWYNEADTYQGIIDTGVGTMHGFFASNEGASKVWLMFFDSATVPADGAEPILPGIPLLLADTTNVGTASAEFTRGRGYTTGLCWAISSTPDTLTIDNTATVGLAVEYR